MLDNKEYIRLSIELHLFFARIMKEHSIFLELGFTDKNNFFKQTADNYKLRFENVLSEACNLATGTVSPSSAASGEFITDFTLGSEQKTQNFTGIAIDQNITRRTSGLWGGTSFNDSPDLLNRVTTLNNHALPQINGIIQFKMQILNDVLSCNIFTLNYPKLIDHMLREATLYRMLLIEIQKKNGSNNQDLLNTEITWDELMVDHAATMRGMFDPSEGELINKANEFAKKYGELLKRAKKLEIDTLKAVTDDTLKETEMFKMFKESGVKGITECRVRGVILPLLADHVLREANHYIRILKQAKEVL